MKVKIGTYRNWIGPYQLAEKLLFWKDKDDDLVDKFGKWLSETIVYDVCEWIHNKKERTVKIRIDRYDVWNMDHTLSLIVVPMLHQLKKDKQGAPYTDDNDVPEELRSTSAPPPAKEYDVDRLHFARWDWILDEMIFAFEHVKDTSWEEECWTGEADWTFVETELGSKMEKGPNHTLTCDMDKLKAINDRVDNGLRLFGKYYRNLWS